MTDPPPLLFSAYCRYILRYSRGEMPISSRKHLLKVVIDWKPARPAHSVTDSPLWPSRAADARTRTWSMYCGKEQLAYKEDFRS